MPGAVPDDGDKIELDVEDGEDAVSRHNNNKAKQKRHSCSAAFAAQALCSQPHPPHPPTQREKRPKMPRILFVSGFHPSTRARDLAYEFERYVQLGRLMLENFYAVLLSYGPLVRCDVPAPRNPHASSNP